MMDAEVLLARPVHLIWKQKYRGVIERSRFIHSFPPAPPMKVLGIDYLITRIDKVCLQATVAGPSDPENTNV